MLELRTGMLAYWDTFAGLVPCKVTAIKAAGEVSFTVTADRGPYQRGDSVWRGNGRVVPRKAVYTRTGVLYIRPFRTIAD